MNEHIKSIIYGLIQQEKGKALLTSIDIPEQFDLENNESWGSARALNAGFIIALTDGLHPKTQSAKEFLTRMRDSSKWAELSEFYLKGIDLIHDEIHEICMNNPEFKNRLESLSVWTANRNGSETREEFRERIWSVFFPEATNILNNRDEEIRALRKKRAVTIIEPNRTPITNPVRQILFTSNALLTVPPDSKPLTDLSVSDNLKDKLADILNEKQLYWYDHPIQIGVENEKNEILYGLNGIEDMIGFERKRGNVPSDKRLAFLLSVSVTHQGLHDITKSYLKEVIKNSKSLRSIDIYVFTENDARQIVNEILLPAKNVYLKSNDPVELLDILGVDGEYGRHYSFLKAISAFWNVLIDPEIKATFKIDLDQVFPQKELVDQTGISALEHLKTPLWGAMGLDSKGNPLELGMIAGNLVNESDIGQSLFTPDVHFPEREITADEHFFFSLLPQALSTEAEMMTRYKSGWLDGKRRCMQRIHVTGGTNGILVNSLRRHRPFTPSFMGRAEDQAYILSVLFDQRERLAYVHKDGLIMRHDKEAFAQEAIRSAYIAKLIGDYIRIIYFSAYARSLPMGIDKLKDILAPFTGCFVSLIPLTVVYLRFAFKASSLFAEGKSNQGLEFLETGVHRIRKAIEFAKGRESTLKMQYERERRGWSLYYDILSSIENGLKKGDRFALDLKKRVVKIIEQCVISGKESQC